MVHTEVSIYRNIYHIDGGFIIATGLHDTQMFQVHQYLSYLEEITGVAGIAVNPHTSLVNLEGVDCR